MTDHQQQRELIMVPEPRDSKPMGIFMTMGVAVLFWIVLIALVSAAVASLT